MGMKEFFKETWDKLKEANKPENVKARLKDDIEITELKIKKAGLDIKRKELVNKRFSFGDDYSLWRKS